MTNRQGAQLLLRDSDYIKQSLRLIDTHQFGRVMYAPKMDLTNPLQLHHTHESRGRSSRRQPKTGGEIPT